MDPRNIKFWGKNTYIWTRHPEQHTKFNYPNLGSVRETCLKIVFIFKVLFCDTAADIITYFSTFMNINNVQILQYKRKKHILKCKGGELYFMRFKGIYK